MMFGSPFFTDFDDESQYYQPRSYQERRKRAIAMEEARRRTELERYYKLKELEEQERHRKQKEYARRLRQEKLLEERLRQERLLEEEQRRRDELRRLKQAKAAAQREDRLRALRYLNGEVSEDEESRSSSTSESSFDEEPIYQLMRGSDGRMYRVQVGTSRKPKVKQPTFARREDKENKPLKQHSISEDDSKHDYLEPMLDEPMIESSANVKSSKSRNKPRKSRKTSLKPNQKKKKVTIIVEDASDSETEDEFYNSPWRNRRPSPGQWMEPVESFGDLHL